MRFGEWPSTITVHEVVSASDGMRQVRAVGDDTYWLASLACEDGRGTIRRWRDGDIVDLTPGANVRTRVNEYGGGTYDVDEAGLVYADDLTKRVWYAPHDGVAVALTDGDAPVRFAGFRLATASREVLAVREDHRAGGEPRTELVALRLDGDNADHGRVIATGADFYGHPDHRDGRVAWSQWNHPFMPWDDCEVWTADLSGEGTSHIAGGNGVSAIHPLFLTDGRLAWTDDSSGFWNIHLDDGAHIADDHDWSPAPWTLEEAPFAQLDETTLVGMRYVDGLGSLTTADVATGAFDDWGFGMADVESVACAGGTCSVISTWPDHAPMLARFVDGALTMLAIAGDAKAMTLPESVWFDGPAGRTHALYYPVGGTEDNPAPVIVFCHGGPTGMVRPGLSLETQFWTNRGISVLDVNYSGSAGFGRAYRDRLQGTWGVLEVADCVAAVRALVERGDVDPAQVAIMGGSAGGYTTLQSLVTSDVFTAGISLYGVGDLEALATDTHKFESRYLDGLIGPYPEAREVYLERSPMHHVDKLSTPMLILQGTDDLVVPLNQAELMAAAVREKGLPLALVVFDGEGHGFRQVANRVAALEAQLSFLAQVWGFTPDGGLPTLEVENL